MGRRLVAGTGDGRVCLWDVDLRSELTVLETRNYQHMNLRKRVCPFIQPESACVNRT